jgi:AcrR family transcriptional regulator
VGPAQAAGDAAPARWRKGHDHTGEVAVARRQTDRLRRSLARGEGMPSSLDIADPIDALPPVARTILEAARRLLADGGYEALTLSAIAEAADEPKASIGYYFGNKDGLIVALVDALTHEANRALLAETEGLPMGERRLHALIDGEVRIADDVESFRSFFAILPHALRDERLRVRVGGLYEGYRETVLRCVAAAGEDELRRSMLPFAMLMIAIVDGLAIQHGLDPDGIDVRAAVELWERLARAHLAERGVLQPG